MTRQDVPPRSPQMSDEPDERFELQDADGRIQTWVLMAVVEHEGGDYALLALSDALENEELELELAVLEYGRDDQGRPCVTAIEDNEVYERVQEFCMRLVDAELSGEPLTGSAN